VPGSIVFAGTSVSATRTTRRAQAAEMRVASAGDGATIAGGAAQRTPMRPRSRSAPGAQ